MIAWLRHSFDIRLVVIAALLVSDAGHAGHLFSVREAGDRVFIGYLLAFCLDAASGIALYDMVNVRKRVRRVFALCVFAFAAVVAGGFSLAYYRSTSPADPLWVSVLMAAVAPVLAGMLSVMRAFGHVERTEGEQDEQAALLALELEKYRIAEQEQTRREVLIEREQTKQVRANARVESAKAKTLAQVKERAMVRSNGRGGNGRLRPGELDDAVRAILLERPDIGPRPLARELNCSPSTASGILRRVAGNGRGGEVAI